MQTKIIEIRDEGTYIPVLCVDMNPAVVHLDIPQIRTQREYLTEQGYPCDGRPNILMTHLAAKGPATNDPYQWDRTRQVAHLYIIEHWNELEDGSVVDVEFILGKTSAPKIRQHLERAARAGGQ